MKYCTFCKCEHELTSQFWYRLEGSPRCRLQVIAKTRKSYNSEQAAVYNKAYRALHRDKLDQANAAWREVNRDRHRQSSRDWYAANKDRARSNHASYTKRRRKSDPCFKLATNLRTRMYRVLRGINKVGSAVRDLGCSLPELKQHLESQFDLGMTWDNYGSVWEVDHILPLANYKLDDRGTYRRLAHHSNLQPLFIHENRQKLNYELTA